ncbi:MAG: ferredoxin, partial [Clostridia bacterium]|nr:ferredoxin [Clostridia bacterium]
MIKGFINKKSVTADKDELILSVISRNGYVMDAPCGGKKRCGKCKIAVTGELSPIGYKERSLLTDDELENGIRLACFCSIQGEVEFNIEMSSGVYEIETGMKDKNIEVNPFTDILKFKKEHENVIGVAVDIGTTTVAVRFYDLINGRHLFTQSAINAQKNYGADVMSRIEYALNNQDGDATLHNAITSQLNGMLNAFSKYSEIPLNDIAEIVIAGNTTMELLAAGYSIKSLGSLPFIPESFLDEYKYASELGYNTPSAQIYFMPAVGGFFGGDAVSVMVAMDFDDEKPKFMVDIGTNGEMAISTGNGNDIFGCSTAAGPAFEGACIRFGTGSVEGAINKVILNGNDKFTFKTIGDKPPIGICGSGLIDVTALSIKKCYIDETGRIDEVLPLFEGENSIPLIADDIMVTQRDIREIQLAKAAICAGVKVIINSANKKTEKNLNIDDIFIAGGFGTALNLENAKIIGLLPPEYCDKAVTVGNAALQGAIMCLLSKNCRERAKALAKKVKLVDLSSDPL